MNERRKAGMFILSDMEELGKLREHTWRVILKESYNE